MKKNYFWMAMLMVMAFHTRGFSQWTDVLNNDINFEFKIWSGYYGGGEPDGESVAEPVMKTRIFIDDPDGTQYWMNELCGSWQTTPPAWDLYADWMYWSAQNRSFGTTFLTDMKFYESDIPETDGCYPHEDDDQNGEANGYLRDGQTTMPIVYPSADFRPAQWIPYLGIDGSIWLYDYLGGPFDQAMALTWRYSAGSSIGDCLNFATINSGTTKSDINANRPVSTQSGVPLQYNNTLGNSSPDVWYSFTIAEKSDVTIRTDYPETDFDTYIRIYDSNATEIGYNDDGGSNSTSVLNTQLCAGTYRFCVEGYDTYNGLFKVSVNATIAPPLSIVNEEIVNASCLNSTDGSATWQTENALGAIDFLVNGWSISENSISNLPVGDYVVYAVDICNSNDTWTFTIANGDNIPPIAICQNSLSVVVSTGNPAVLTVDEVNNGSSDNCADATASISPSTFDVFDEGDNVVTMIVTDANGLTAECTCTVNVEVVVGLEEMNEAKPIILQPNPNNGSFQLDLSAHHFSTNAQMQIVDCTGRVVYQSKVVNSKNIVSLADAAPGVYLMNLTDNDHKISARFVVQ
ncbi:MAG: DVUA0089 family protein [Flavobacteriales bacterium]|nr:DVUA0089 family protein [Flavobacteriales bacterium]